MKTILATAYAVNPYKGSEDGMGWNFILQIARNNNVIAVTRKNNRQHIERYISEHQIENVERIKFLYFDLPYWMRFWKKGEMLSMIYFYLWQLIMPFFIRSTKINFDIAHNLNFHNDWTPTFLWLLRKPLIWGPVGHHPKVPSQYLKNVFGYKAWLADRFKWAFKNIFWKLDPFLKIASRKASVILCMNTDVKNYLKVKSEKSVICSSVATESVECKKSFSENKFHVLSVGRFVWLKGFDITIQSFAKFYYSLNEDARKNAKLTLVGDGSEKEKLKNMAAELKVLHAVQFIEWINRADLAAIYQEADLFFFPSHEGAGMVVAEAMSYGLPVMCFDNCGPGEFVTNDCGIKIPYNNYQKSIESFAKGLSSLHQSVALRELLSKNAIQRFRMTYDWNVKGDILKDVYVKATSPRIIAVHLLDDYSGSPRVLAQAVKGFSEKGSVVKIFTGKGSKGILHETGLPVKHYTYRFFENKFLRTLSLSFSQLQLFTHLLFTLKKSDVVYVNTLLPFGAAPAAKLRGCKVIYHLHETSVQPAMLKKFLKWIVRACGDKIIHVSNYLMQHEAVHSHENIVVYNGLSKEFIDEVKTNKSDDVSNRFNVLMLCSLKEYKGVNDFISLARKLPNIHFEMVLNAKSQEVNSFFSNMKLPDNITLHSSQAHVHGFYRRAHLVLNLSHPERWVETFGLTIIEAAAYGIPCIVPEVGGPAEIVEHGKNGFTISVHRLDVIAQTIDMLSKQPETWNRLSANALKKSSEFSDSKMTEALFDAVMY